MWLRSPAARQDAAEEGRDIILSMLVVGLVFLAVIRPRRPDRAARAPQPPRTSPAARVSPMIRVAMRPDLPSGTVTFLFTDVEGSTRLLHELGAEGYAEALAEHRRVIREACAAEGGSRWTRRATPSSSPSRPRPARSPRRGALTEALASGPIQVRVGLHTGTPLLTDEGYVGDDVHFAARVAAAGHGGQVLVSARDRGARRASRSPTSASTASRTSPQAVSIFQLGDGSFPPLKTISNTNLPRPASSFVGRRAELAEVLGAIEGGARLVTLTGPGGTGKTRLALEAASSLVPEYKAGVFWVGSPRSAIRRSSPRRSRRPSAPRTGSPSTSASARCCSCSTTSSRWSRRRPSSRALLARCPNLAVLVTSRELLRVQGEVEYPVPPLAEPEAVALFCPRSQLAPSEEIGELCARLDELPLAVELAAARTKALSPAQILERLSQRLDLLKGGRDADPRQQTLRATIEWSYDLLIGGGAAAVRPPLGLRRRLHARGRGGGRGADLDTLQSLVEKSLLRFTDERYWMLETIREFAPSDWRSPASRKSCGGCTRSTSSLSRSPSG